MVDPMDMVILRIDRSLQDKVILIIQGMKMRGGVMLYLKGREMSIPYLLSLGVVRR